MSPVLYQAGLLVYLFSWILGWPVPVVGECYPYSHVSFHEVLCPPEQPAWDLSYLFPD